MLFKMLKVTKTVSMSHIHFNVSKFILKAGLFHCFENVWFFVSIFSSQMDCLELIELNYSQIKLFSFLSISVQCVWCIYVHCFLYHWNRKYMMLRYHWPLFIWWMKLYCLFFLVLFRFANVNGLVLCVHGERIVSHR